MNKFGLQRAYCTREGCEVVEVRSVSTRDNVLTPVTNIVMWVPEKELDKPNKPL